MSNKSDVNTDYKAAGFGKELTFGKKPALLLIDFVQAYFDPKCALYANVEHALASALRVLDIARKKNIPIIYTNLSYQCGMKDGGRFFEKLNALNVFANGSNHGDWPEGVAPKENEFVISKQYPSAFFGTTLSSTLTAQSVDSVILTGLTTSGCIRATCVDAVSHGFTTFVVSDACGDRHQAPHNANLFDMQAKYAEIVDEGKIAKYLRKL